MNLPTDEELVLIRRSVLLPLLLKVIGDAEQEAERTKSSMQRLYVRSVRKLFDDVQVDLVAVRRELSQRKIKVMMQDVKPEYAAHYFYTVDGFSAEVGIFKNEAREDLGKLLAGYINEMFKSILSD